MPYNSTGAHRADVAKFYLRSVIYRSRLSPLVRGAQLASADTAVCARRWPGARRAGSWILDKNKVSEELRAISEEPLAKALQQMQAAANRGARQFRIPAGDYHFGHTRFELRNARNMEVTASGVSFWFGWGGGMRCLS